MLVVTSTNYGDADFGSRLLTPDNRLEPFAKTDLIISGGLAANSRYQTSSSFLGVANSYNVTYLGPSNNNNNAGQQQVYAVPIPFTYTITADGTMYRYAVVDANLPLVTVTDQAPGSFSFDDWNDFYLYDKAVGGKILTTKERLSSTSPQLFTEPFGGGSATAGQINAMTSPYLCDISGMVPTYLAQLFSTNRYYIENNKEAGFLAKWWGHFTNTLTANLLYGTLLLGVTGDFAPCTNWPEKCDSTTSRFIDGGFAEMFSKFWLLFVGI